MRQVGSYNKKQHYTSINIKIFIPIVVCLILSYISLYFFIIKHLETSLHTIMEEQISNLTHSVTHNIDYVMETEHRNEVAPILQNLKENRSIFEITITDPAGKIFKSTNPAVTKIRIPDRFKSGSYFIKNETSYRAYTALENKEECHRCHGSKNAINGILVTDISLEHFFEFEKEVKEYFIITSLIICIPLILIIFVAINWTVMRPINLLKASMEQVKNGELNTLTDYAGNDEMGDLIDGFNQMITKIDTLYKEVEKLYQKEIQKAGQIALTGELAIGLAHEIRNPLAGIRGAIEVLKDDAEFAVSYKQILPEILHEMDRINTILNDLLHYAKPKELEPSKFNINELISQTVVLAQNQVIGKEISFIYANPDEPVYVKADPMKLQQVLLNLFINSIQSIKDKGIIEIEEYSIDKVVELKIKDTGQGIPEDKLPDIFKPFFTTKSRGTGLGLSLSKKIIEQHNGKIWAESKVNEGTTIHISLPLWE